MNENPINYIIIAVGTNENWDQTTRFILLLGNEAYLIYSEYSSMKRVVHLRKMEQKISKEQEYACHIGFLSVIVTV